MKYIYRVNADGSRDVVQYAADGERPAQDWIIPLSHAECDRITRAHEVVCTEDPCRSEFTFVPPTERATGFWRHSNGSDCAAESADVGSKEGLWHLAAKALFRGVASNVSFEEELVAPDGRKTRVDVLVNLNGVRTAIEIQHSNILYETIETRMAVHAAAGIGHTVWVIDMDRIGATTETVQSLLRDEGRYFEARPRGAVLTTAPRSAQSKGRWSSDSARHLGVDISGGFVPRVLRACSLTGHPTTILLLGEAESANGDTDWAARVVSEFTPFSERSKAGWRIRSVGERPLSREDLRRWVTGGDVDLLQGWVPAIDVDTAMWLAFGDRRGYTMRSHGAPRPRQLDPHAMQDGAEPCPCTYCELRVAHDLPPAHGNLCLFANDEETGETHRWILMWLDNAECPFELVDPGEVLARVWDTFRHRAAASGRLRSAVVARLDGAAAQAKVRQWLAERSINEASRGRLSISSVKGRFLLNSLGIRGYDDIRPDMAAFGWREVSRSGRVEFDRDLGLLPLGTAPPGLDVRELAGRLLVSDAPPTTRPAA